MSADDPIKIGEIWEFRVSEGPFFRQQAQEALRLAVAHLTKAGYPGRDGWVQAGQDDPFPHGSLEWVAVQIAEAASLVDGIFEVATGRVPEAPSSPEAVEKLAEMSFQLGYYRAVLRTISSGPDGSFLDFSNTGGGMRRARGVRKAARQKQAGDDTARKYGNWARQAAAEIRGRNPKLSDAQLAKLVRARHEREQPEGVDIPNSDRQLVKAWILGSD